MRSMRFKVGDRVKMKSLNWYNENKDEYGVVDINYDFAFYADRSKYCGKVLTISEVFDNCYSVKEDNGEYYWTDEMFEGLVEEETKPCININDMNNDAIIIPTSAIVEMVKELGISCPDGYIFKDENGNVINAQKIVLEKKKREYLKSFGECCKVLGTYSYNQSIVGYKNELFSALQKLLICRDAYWKIAGEEMGLGKPWEPNDDVEIYNIYRVKNAMYFGGVSWSGNSNILEFPTENMRDAFYENFKSEIESCKELL